jgi:hypothetical protein
MRNDARSFSVLHSNREPGSVPYREESTVQQYLSYLVARLPTT